MVHSYNQFHAAGHGTFFSGQLSFGRAKNDRFLWVYDCGSKRPSRMNGLVADLHMQTGVNVIDMLCISHFDGDHVNGLLELLKTFNVKQLFLPYLPFSKRLQIACELDLDVAGSTDAMLFVLDPVGFLEARDLSDRVRGIVLVRGDEGDGENVPRDISNLPILPNTPNGDFQERYVDAFVQNSRDYELLIGASGHVGVSSMSHMIPITWQQNAWEFVFYNKELPNGIAPVSGANLSEIQADVIKVLDKRNLKASSFEGLRKDLRKCYEKHFGKSSKGRNDISLCLHSRPFLRQEVEQCSLFHTPSSGLACAHTLIPVSNEYKAGLLLTGDICINDDVLNKMIRHFNQSRWDDIHVMQIPHHGSRHSWKSGSAALCKQEYSVLCVPELDSSGSHPHQSVLDDLEDRNPLYANYSTSVVYCFHIS